MCSIGHLLELLSKILAHKELRKQGVEEFESVFEDCRKESMPSDVFDVFADLAVDLEYFVFDPTVRMEDSSYYGHDRLEEEIEKALFRLQTMGIEVPT